jgi:hypothetical protein
MVKNRRRRRFAVGITLGVAFGMTAGWIVVKWALAQDIGDPTGSLS